MTPNDLIPVELFLRETEKLGAPMTRADLDAAVTQGWVPRSGVADALWLATAVLVPLLPVGPNDDRDAARDRAYALDRALRGRSDGLRELADLLDGLLARYAVLGELHAALSFASPAALDSLRGPARLEWRMRDVRTWVAELLVRRTGSSAIPVLTRPEGTPSGSNPAAHAGPVPRQSPTPISSASAGAGSAGVAGAPSTGPLAVAQSPRPAAASATGPVPVHRPAGPPPVPSAAGTVSRASGAIPVPTGSVPRTSGSFSPLPAAVPRPASTAPTAPAPRVEAPSPEAPAPPIREPASRSDAVPALPSASYASVNSGANAAVPPGATPTGGSPAVRPQVDPIDRFVNGTNSTRRRIVAMALTSGWDAPLAQRITNDPRAAGMRATFWLLMAEMRRLRAEWDLALQALDRALDEGAQPIDVLRERVAVLEASHRRLELAASLRVLSELCDDEEYRLLSLRRARMLAEDDGDVDGAIEVLEDVVATRRHDETVADRLLALLETAGRHASVLEVCRRLSEFSADDSERRQWLDRAFAAARHVSIEAELEAGDALVGLPRRDARTDAAVAVVRLLAAPDGHDSAALAARVNELRLDTGLCIAQARSRNPSQTVLALDRLARAFAARQRWGDAAATLEALLGGTEAVAAAIDPHLRAQLFERLAVACERMNASGAFTAVGG